MAEKRAGSNGEHSARALIRPRPRVSSVAAVVMSLVFALLATPLLMVDGILAGSDSLAFETGKVAPITVRAPQFGYDTANMRFEGGAIVVARGQTVTHRAERQVTAIQAEQPKGAGAWLAYMLGLFLLGLLYTTQVRRTHGGKLLRTQAVTLLSLIVIAGVVKGALLFTAMSILVVPVAAVAMVAAMVVDLSVGISTGVVCAVLLGLLTPFDVGVLVVLAVQGVAAALMLGPGTKHKKRHILLAGGVGGLAAATAYAAFFYLSSHTSPMSELSTPLQSAWLAAAAGGLLGGVFAIVLKPAYQWLLGEITRNKLVELEDLSNPLLKQISEQAPGSWQHSLAMANMAEIAANAIGANGRLVRVGAYYHDLGKSLQSSYFIENLQPGESSPHDRLPPEVSCDAIFAHVTEGVRLGRERGLPERICDFMHMHHGDGLLEYFWAKCQEQGNPKNLTENDFRYPGIRPQTRETAILAICDAVEAASRTLKNPDEHAVRNLVERIVYGKLHLGQLDESGLSVPDLRRVSDSLIETIKHAYHGRIEYPWQRKQREAAEQDTTKPQRPRAPSEMASQAARAVGQASASVTQRIIDEPRLDSLDVPRPYWRERTASKPIEHAATERVSAEDAAVAASASSSSSMPAASSSNSMPAASSSNSMPRATTSHSEASASGSHRAVTTDPGASGVGETVLLSKPKEKPREKDRPDTDPDIVPAAMEAPSEPAPAPQPAAAPAPAPQPAPVLSASAMAASAAQTTPEVETTLQGLGKSRAPAAAILAAARADYEKSVEPTPEPRPDTDAESRIDTNPLPDRADTAAEEALEPPDPVPAKATTTGPIVKVTRAPSVPEVKQTYGRETLEGPGPARAQSQSPSPAKKLAGPLPVVTPDIDNVPTIPATPTPNEPPQAPPSKKPAQVLADLVASARERAEAEAESEVTLVRKAPTSRAKTTRAMPAPAPAPPAPVDPEESSNQLAEWTEALTKTQTGANPLAKDEAKRGRRRGRRRPPPPPPGSPDRGKPRGTIQLMDDAAPVDDGPAAPLRAVTRADSESDALSPGMMIIGPPPATHASGDDD